MLQKAHTVKQQAKIKILKHKSVQYYNSTHILSLNFVKFQLGYINKIPKVAITKEIKRHNQCRLRVGIHPLCKGLGARTFFLCSLYPKIDCTVYSHLFELISSWN